jgi:hypothetical protein
MRLKSLKKELHRNHKIVETQVIELQEKAHLIKNLAATMTEDQK